MGHISGVPIECNPLYHFNRAGLAGYMHNFSMSSINRQHMGVRTNYPPA